MEVPMFDRVQKAMERMATELEDYQSRKIFTPKEISKISETRRRFENKLQRTEKKLQDFIQYAGSEKMLERLRNRRIKNLGIQKTESDAQLAQNVISIYQRALYHFHEPILLKEFAEYAIKHKEYSSLKTILGEKCAKFLKDTDLWIFTARKLWEINEIEEARNVFLKCLGINKQVRVFIEFFRFECAYAARLLAINEEIGISEEEKGEIERGDLAFAIFESFYGQATPEELSECLEISQAIPGLQQRLHALT